LYSSCIILDMRIGTHEPRPARIDRAEADRLERQLVTVIMNQLRPALEIVFRDLQNRVETLVGNAVGRQLAQTSRLRRIGETKRCSVCGLEGARNVSSLRRGHSVDEHQRQRERLKPAGRKRTAAAPAHDQLRVVG
jgi:hypothetical protein